MRSRSNSTSNLRNDPRTPAFLTLALAIFVACLIVAATWFAYRYLSHQVHETAAPYENR